MLPLLLAVQTVVASPSIRGDMLRVWVDAAEQHHPGLIDAAAERVRRLGAAELELVVDDLRAVVKLIDDPRATIFYPRQENGSANRLRPLVYTDNHLRILRDVARRTAARGDGSRLLKRGAVLHTDLALFAGTDGGAVTNAPAGALQRTTVFVEDGRQVGLVSAVDHWETARRVLDEVRSRPDRDDPDPQRDDDVRLWYRATATLLLGRHQVDLPHFADAVRLFPKDPDILFLAGSHRDMASAPGVYQALRQARGPRGPVMNLESQEGELRLAESFFERALAVNPGHPEARLRLGRILARRGRSGPAARELQAAVAATTDPLLLYYGHLFLGSALDAQREPAAARAAYERAAALAPEAQSPRLALSQLLARSGHRAGAMAAIDTTLTPQAIDHIDPLWSYFITPGRVALELMEQMYRRLGREPER